MWGPDPTSPRRLAVLIDGLPGDDHGWTPDHELAAQTVDAMHALLTLTAKANSDKKGRRKIGDPYRVPRPWDPPPAAKLSAYDRLARFAETLNTLGGE